MKKIITKYITLVSGVLMLFSTSSCQDFLTVDPRGDYPDYMLFTTEEGFRNSIVGLYAIARKGTYSVEDGPVFGGFYGTSATLSGYLGAYSQYFTQDKGFLEQMSCFWPLDIPNDWNSDEVRLFRHEYDYQGTRDRAEYFFINSYKIVTNANLILRWLDDESNEGLLDEQMYNIVKGEAMGMKAFALFDLIRTFGPPPMETAYHDDIYIPYPDKLTTDPYEGVSYAYFIDRLYADVDEALQCLKDHDPICTKSVAELKSDNSWLGNRHTRMNYYAVLALKAKLSLWMGNSDNKQMAFNCATEIIEAVSENGTRQFVLAPWNSYTLGTNMIPTSEIIFGMPIFKPLQGFIYSSTSGGTTTPSNLRTLGGRNVPFIGETTDFKHLKDVFEGNVDTDIRLTKWFYETNYLYHPVKYSGFSNTSNLIPMIRLSEMYLIAAECDQSYSGATTYINDLRDARFVNGVNPGVNLTSDNRQERIISEYVREFIGEGQTFFMYKRFNLETLPFSIYKYRSDGDFVTDIAGDVGMDFNSYTVDVPWSERMPVEI